VNGVLFVSNLDAQLAALRCNRQALVSQLARQVKRLSQRLLQREPLRVLGHRLLDSRADLRRRTEEAVRRHQAADALVRAAEVVAVDEERHPPRAVFEVGEDGAP
jgi:hypothetical protein